MRSGHKRPQALHHHYQNLSPLIDQASTISWASSPSSPTVYCSSQAVAYIQMSPLLRSLPGCEACRVKCSTLSGVTTWRSQEKREGEEKKICVRLHHIVLLSVLQYAKSHRVYMNKVSWFSHSGCFLARTSQSSLFHTYVVLVQSTLGCFSSREKPYEESYKHNSVAGSFHRNQQIPWIKIGIKSKHNLAGQSKPSNWRQGSRLDLLCCYEDRGASAWTQYGNRVENWTNHQLHSILDQAGLDFSTVQDYEDILLS